MKLMVIGGGGREHALVWKLAQSPRVRQIWCAPGNAGIAAEPVRASGALARCVAIAADDLPALQNWAKENRPDLIIVAPDNPLALGAVDRFQADGWRAWGPTRRAAQFESSKVFAHEFMQRHRIPTAAAGVFNEFKAASRFAASLGGRCAVKADGLALGKGVLICRDMAQADHALEQVLVRKTFGAAGDRVLVQELLEGVEVSLHALCDGQTARLFPTSQDHKRVLDGDRGLNTGGMGTYSPAPFLNEAAMETVQQSIIAPWIKGCAAEGIDFRGILYPGLMLTAQGPKVLEFNARFGDPETQVYLPRLESDLVDLIEASLEGRLAAADLRWSPRACVCVVLASGGYPGAYAKGKTIRGLEEVSQLPHVKVFHAGTARSGSDWVSQGGRVLGVTAWGPTLAAARDTAYDAVRQIQFEGAHYRTDIATKALPAA